MRLKEYTSLPKSAGVSFKMTHLPIFYGFHILKTSNNIYSHYFSFYNIINHKQILTKNYNHQEHTYCYLRDNKNTMREQK